MSGKLGDLSESQAAALAELKERKQAIMTPYCTDAFLLRILRSAKFAMPRAEAKLQAAMEFRKKWGADTILEDYTPPPLLAKYYPTAFLDECDRHGNLVTFFFPGRLDIKGLIKTNSRDDIIRYTVYNKEVLERKLRQVSARKGRTVDTIHSIIDCEGLDSTVLWPPALDLLGRIGEGDKHSPELLAMTSIFRASRIFNILVGITKPFLGASTRERLRFHGSDWKEKLLVDLHPETLPEEFGGTLPSSELVWGGRIPKELYLENSEELILQVVEAGKKFTTEVVLLRPGEIMWEFVTDNHDIGFGIKRLEADKALTDIIPTKRVSGHVGTIEGSHPVPPGTYVLEWDNSFSWTKPKKLRYLCSAVESADDS